MNKSMTKILVIALSALFFLTACESNATSVNNSEVAPVTTTAETTVTTVPETTTAPPATTTTAPVTTTVAPKPVQQAQAKPAAATTTAPKPTDKEIKEQQAKVVAKKIADSIGPGSDLERVNKAAEAVSQYCKKAKYTTSGTDYCEAYGVFISGQYSCAGATRALGMVLSYMGYKWEHVNCNQWTHQWCKLTMDGKIGFADGQVGWVGYGEHPAP